MSKLLLLLVTLLLGTCAHPITQVPSVSTASSTEPFSFKGTYDANEIYQKKGIYYINSFIRGGGYVQDGKFVDYYPVVIPHKMQGTAYIFERGKPTSDGPGIEIGFSRGNFIDGRKDGPWVYVTFAKPEVTIREEYRMGKLLSRKPGPRYLDSQ
jgi:hypothetical protein